MKYLLLLIITMLISTQIAFAQIAPSVPPPLCEVPAPPQWEPNGIRRTPFFGSQDDIGLNWTDVIGTTYTVEYSLDGGQNWTTVYTGLTESFVLDGGIKVPSNATVNIRVQARIGPPECNTTYGSLYLTGISQPTSLSPTTTQVPLPTKTPTPIPSTQDPCPNKIFGNLNCDLQGLINSIDFQLFLNDFFGKPLVPTTSKANFLDDGSAIIDTGDYEVFRQHYSGVVPPQ